jgi:preprotein translocase subunit SecG
MDTLNLINTPTFDTLSHLSSSLYFIIFGTQILTHNIHLALPKIFLLVLPIIFFMKTALNHYKLNCNDALFTEKCLPNIIQKLTLCLYFLFVWIGIIINYTQHALEDPKWLLIFKTVLLAILIPTSFYMVYKTFKIPVLFTLALTSLLLAILYTFVESDNIINLLVPSDKINSEVYKETKTIMSCIFAFSLVILFGKLSHESYEKIGKTN